MEKKQKVPALRFQGFSGEWEKTTVGKIFEVTRGETLAAPKTSPTQNPVMNYPVYSSQTKNNGLMGYYSEYLFENAITWTTDGANAGTVRFRKGKFYCTNVCGVLLSKQGYANTFMAEALNKVAWKHVSKVGNPKLMNNVMKEISIHAPKTIDEQNELAEYIEKLDLNIFNRMQKIRKLQQFRQAMLTKLFPWEGAAEPELRFRGFSGKWKQNKLGDLVVRITRKNSNMESDLPLTISAVLGLVSQREYFNNRVASGDVSRYYLIKKGEFAYNKSYSDGYPFGAVKRLDKYDKGVLSTLYIIFSPKKDAVQSDYLAAYYDTTGWYKEVAARAAEGARNHGLLNISPDDFFDTMLKLPESKEEQQQIGTFFKNLDDFISLQQKKLERMQRLKAALLEKLFV